MKVCTYTLENTAKELISTEIRFDIASARAGGYELLCINSKKTELDVKQIATVLKNLRMIKKEGKIDFFATAEDFEKGSEKASYLINKFPDITEFLSDRSFILIIKL